MPEGGIVLDHYVSNEMISGLKFTHATSWNNSLAFFLHSAEWSWNFPLQWICKELGRERRRQEITRKEKKSTAKKKSQKRRSNKPITRELYKQGQSFLLLLLLLRVTRSIIAMFFLLTSAIDVAHSRYTESIYWDREEERERGSERKRSQSKPNEIYIIQDYPHWTGIAWNIPTIDIYVGRRAVERYTRAYIV